MQIAEIILGIASIVLALGFYFLAGSFPAPRSKDVGMAFYPRILSVIIILLSLSVIYQSVRKKRRDNSNREPLFELKDNGFKRVLLMIGMTIVYQQVLDVLGFLIITPIFLIILMLVFRASAVWKIVLISVLTTFLVYVVFQLFLKIPLPTGIFYN